MSIHFTNVSIILVTPAYLISFLLLLLLTRVGAVPFVLLIGVELRSVHGLHVLAERAWVSVALRAASCLAHIGFLNWKAWY